MRKAEVFPYYKSCCKWLSEMYEFLKTQFGVGYVEDLAKLRGYVDPHQIAMIKDMQLGCCAPFVEDLGEHAKEMGLVTDSGHFLLENRYIIPVDDVAGNLCALIGYYPDKRKYITTPSPYFAKGVQFFNFHQAYELSWSEFDGLVFVVEGIFDCLSLRAIGLPCMSVMGASLSRELGELLKLFKKVVAIPDNDAIGKRSLNRYGRFGWKVPDNTVMVSIKGGIYDAEEGLIVKDMDDFVSWYDTDSVRECLLSLAESKEEIEELII